MLIKRQDGLWVDRLGFVAAIMLKWNTEVDGIKHYVFLANAYHTQPYDITSNDIDDSVLISVDMYNILVARNVARPITDEEAANANKNESIELENALLAQNEIKTKLALKAEADKPASTTNPSQPAKPVKVATENSISPEMQAILTAAKIADVSAKKGK